MNIQFNTIESISNSKENNKSELYLSACESFEVEASKYADNENFICRKSAEQVSIEYAKAKSADCEYSVYTAAFSAEKWLEKAYNNAD